MSLLKQPNKQLMDIEILLTSKTSYKYLEMTQEESKTRAKERRISQTHSDLTGGNQGSTTERLPETLPISSISPMNPSKRLHTYFNIRKSYYFIFSCRWKLNYEILHKGLSPLVI